MDQKALQAILEQINQSLINRIKTKNQPEQTESNEYCDKCDKLKEDCTCDLMGQKPIEE